MKQKLLEIRDISVHFDTMDGDVKAVNHVSLDICRGKTLGLVGETGAGKTTTALAVLRLIQSPPGEISSGEILYDGKNILEMNTAELQHLRGGEIAMIFQDPMTALNPIFTVEEQIAETISIHQDVSREDAVRLAREKLEMVGIPGERGAEYPHQFSGGMKQRVVIAMALACSPRLLIADEPTTALDVTIQAQVLEMINELKEQHNAAMLLITHDLGVVAETCDDVAIMYAGEILEYGTAEHIFESALRHPYTTGLFDSLPSLDESVERLKPIPGLMPDPTALPEGCPFHPRCPHATEGCAIRHPEMTEVEDGHFIRCIRFGEKEMPRNE